MNRYAVSRYVVALYDEHTREGCRARAIELAAARNSVTRESTTHYCDDANYKGALGEVVFAHAYGLRSDEGARPSGDGGIDFRVRILGRPVSIDVKTSSYGSLVVKEHNINRLAKVLVLAQYDKHSDWVKFVGWETNDIMGLTPPSEFKNNPGKKVRKRVISQLRDMDQLEELMPASDQ